MEPDPGGMGGAEHVLGWGCSAGGGAPAGLSRGIWGGVEPSPPSPLSGRPREPRMHPGELLISTAAPGAQRSSHYEQKHMSP